MADNRITIPVLDGNGKTSTVTFPVGASTPGDAAITSLYDAMGAIIKGKRRGANFVVETPKDAADVGLAPGSATRSNKWLCTYQDNVDTSTHTLEIPTADLDLQAVPSNALDLTSVEGAAFKTAFEAAVLSPLQNGGIGGGNAVTLLSVEFVNRNLKAS